MSLLHGNLHKLSSENLKKLLQYYETGILTSESRTSHHSEITKQKAISQGGIDSSDRFESDE